MFGKVSLSCACPTHPDELIQWAFRFSAVRPTRIRTANYYPVAFQLDAMMAMPTIEIPAPTQSRGVNFTPSTHRSQSSAVATYTPPYAA